MNDKDATSSTPNSTTGTNTIVPRGNDLDDPSMHVEKKLPRGVKRYRKGRVVATTIYGAIRYGKDIVTGEWVIIKECLIEKVGVQRSLDGHSVPEDVNMEIELHSRLCQADDFCPYIIQLKEVCQDKQYIYIILEYAPEGDLFSYVNTSIQKIVGVWQTTHNREVKDEVVKDWQNNVRKWLRQLLLALKFMHERNICHRDISLENMVLSKDKDVKVIDMGVAHDYKDGNFTTERSMIGKQAYMSPECYLNHYYNGRDNDMWCAGVVLWMCLVGCPPWETPCVNDKRFVLLMRGIGGIKGLVSRWKRYYLMPDTAADLLSKIFRPQKDRITVDEALRHPFITGASKCTDPDLYIPIAQSKLDYQRPDAELAKKWSSFRDQGKLTRPPAVWSKISLGDKDAIQKYLWSINKSTGSIFDRRVTQEMGSRFKISDEEIHDILIYYMAASRNRLKMTDCTAESLLKPKPSAVLKYHVSERKAQERRDSQEKKVSVDATSKNEEKEELHLMTAFRFEQAEDKVSHPLNVKATATLNQLKLDFALLGTKKLNLPFIPPNWLDIFVDGEVLQDTSQLRDGCVLTGQWHFDETGPDWFREVSKDERVRYFTIFVSSSQDYLTTAKRKQKFLEELETKFRIKNEKCLEVWEHFSSSQLSDLDLPDQVSLDGIAPECEWLKLLSNDVFGRVFAQVLGNIVIANIGDKKTSSFLEEKGLTRDKAIQAIEHFSQVLDKKAKEEQEDPLIAQP